MTIYFDTSNLIATQVCAILARKGVIQIGKPA
jgi:hypothetical protein